MQLPKRVLKGALRRMGFDLSRIREPKPEEAFPPDFDQATKDICQQVHPFTMTSPERIGALREGIKHIVRHQIQGDIVECGVWKGGSMMAAALTLQELGATERNLFLFDTFEGMPTPGDDDVSLLGEQAAELLSNSDEQSLVRAYGAFEEVKHNVFSTGYPQDRLHFIKGRVEETIPLDAPSLIALLRLDTDWYESTYHEFVHLFPRLSLARRPHH